MSPRAFPTYCDGYLGAARRISRTPREYPFAALGDLTAAMYTATYLIDQAAFTPTARGTVDPENAGFYLVAETKPAIESGDIATFARTYASLPGTQTDPSRSLMVNLPGITGPFPKVFGAYRLFQPDTTLLKYDAYAAKLVTSDSGAPASFYPTGGTYTLTFAGSTTAAIAYNASAATVQTELNALTPISDRGNVTVTGSYNSAGGLVITFNSYATGTVNTAAVTTVTGASLTSAVALTNSGYTQAVSIYATGIDAATPSVDTSGLSPGFPPSAIYSAFTQASGVLTLDISCAAGASGSVALTAFGNTTGAIGIFYSDEADLLNNFVGALNALAGVVSRGTFTGYVATYSKGPGTVTNLRLVFILAPKLTGGTYTLTMFGQTTGAIAYNAAIATIQTALNALSEVQTKRGGCTISGVGLNPTSTSIDFTISFSNSQMTSSAASLTIAPCTISISSSTAPVGKVQTVTFSAAAITRTIYAAAHGIVSTDTIYLKAGSTYYSAIAGSFTIPDASTITLTIAASAAYAAAGTFTEVGKRTTQNYAPGSRAIPATVITRYSLTALAPDTYEGEGDALLEAIFSGATAINYRIGDAARWPNEQSSILSLSTTQISAADL